MSCNCVPYVVTPPEVVGGSSSCEECLKVVTLRYLCTNGPAPCGGEDGTLVVDLTDYNDDVSACDCGSVVYSIVSYDTTEFSSVTITQAGVLTVVTSSTFTEWKDGMITYKVDCPCNILSGTGKIYICKENLCSGVTCAEGEICNQCDGTCVEGESDIELDGEVQVV